MKRNVHGHTLISDNADELYRQLLERIMESGETVAPRGQVTQELRNMVVILTDPLQNVITSKTRKINHRFAIAEWLWILSGSNRLRDVSFFNSILEKYSDDGLHMTGAYGPVFIDQFPYIIQTLERDPDSRQAIDMIWRPRPGSSKDIPCTLSLHFMIRDGKLELTTTMRSNDAWLGFPYDLFTFTRLQATIARLLSIFPGVYTHQVASMHLYESDFNRAETLLETPSVSDADDDFRSPELAELFYKLPHEHLREAFRLFNLVNYTWTPGNNPAVWLKKRLHEAPQPWVSYIAILASKQDKAFLPFIDPPYNRIIS